MSKVIKANNLVYINANKKNEDNNCFSLEDREELFQETKLMLEDLISDAKIKAASFIENAKKEADLIILTANQEAQGIIENANIEAEKITNDAYSLGLKNGEEAGRLKADDLVNEANQLVKHASQEKVNILNKVDAEIINLAIRISEKIIRRQIERNQDTMEFIAKHLLKMVEDANGVAMKVNRDDYIFLENHLHELQPLITQGRLQVEVDGSLAKGDCLIISETGIVSAKIDSQLEKIRNALMEVTT